MFGRDALWKLLRTSVGVFLDLLTFFRLMLRTPQAVAAENLFLRKQLALYVERKTKPHRATDAVRFTLAQLSRFLMARHANRRETRYADPLASEGISVVLEMGKSRTAGRRRVSLEVRKL